MSSHQLPEVSEPSAAAVDPCAAARCEQRAEREVPLRLGGQDRQVPLCERHATRWSASGG